VPRDALIANDDVVWGAIDHGIPDALRFILAHELAHHALGHTGTLRTAMRTTLLPLSRLDELSADAVALQLVGSRDAALEGLTLLTVGPQLYKYVNLAELRQQAKRVAGDKQTKKAGRQLSHPLLLRRLARINDEQLRFG
jgi:Zn-dependent protease with chaperone function